MANQQERTTQRDPIPQIKPQTSHQPRQRMKLLNGMHPGIGQEKTGMDGQQTMTPGTDTIMISNGIMDTLDNGNRLQQS